MKFRQTAIEGARIIELERRADERGFFARAWCEEELQQESLTACIAQINTAYSPRAGTLRGLHFQLAPHAEVKIARCVRGAVYDVIVDLRRESRTYRKWLGVTLTPESGESLYVPQGCAHGYLTLKDDTELMYFTSKPYAPQAARGVRFDDPAFAIKWPAEIRIVSDADRAWPEFFREYA
jgi:dTDP-4-dehydrorhamnose 3,5-epimerase